MFDKKSRYITQQTYEVTDRRGRSVKVVSVPLTPGQNLHGVHKMRQGQRLDHLAYKYLDNPAGFWRICEFNNAMNAEILTEADEISIPFKE